MARTVGASWAPASTGWRNVNWVDTIDAGFVVHISASEARLDGDVGAPLDIIDRWRGLAVIGVRNVTAHADQGGGGGVEFYLEIGWDQPLHVVTDGTVFDAQVQGYVVGR